MPLLVQCLKLFTKRPTTHFIRQLSTRTNSNILQYSPILSSLHVTNSWIWQKPEPIKMPVNSIKPINLPNLINIHPLIEPCNSVIPTIIEDPLTVNNENKEAARLIVIRRKKMKKHKLKKLRKRMKYEWAKLRQRRELKKEKEFQAVLITQCKEAEAFSAEEYVANKIKQVTEKPPPHFTETTEFKELMKRKKLRLYQYENLNK